MGQIFKQTSWLLLAQGITRLIGFFYTIFLAKNLGVSDFGQFSVALAYFSIISSIVDFGFNRFLIKEIARDKSKISDLIWNVAMLRLTLTAIIFAFFAVILYLADPDKIRLSLILLATMAILPQSVALTFDTIFIALRNLKFSAIALFLSSSSTVFAGVILINSGMGAIGAVNALIFGQLIYSFVLMLFLFQRRALELSEIRLEVIKKVIRGSLPYGLLGVLGLLYFRVDTVLLSYIKGSFETGIYAVAYRFLEAVTFIPAAFSAAIFPVFARLHDSSPGDLKKLYFKSLKIMFILGVVTLLGYLFVLPQIIGIFLQNYLSSIVAIKILALSIPFMFIHVPAVAVLLSTDKYLGKILILSFLILLFNIVSNLTFIPQFGFIAAAWITIISEFLSFIIFFLFTKNEVLKRVS